MISDVQQVAISPDERWIAFSGSTLAVARNPLYTPLGDLNNDSCIDDSELIAMLSAFGGTDAVADMDGNGIVDDSDLLTALFNFGEGC